TLASIPGVMDGTALRFTEAFQLSFSPDGRFIVLRHSAQQWAVHNVRTGERCTPLTNLERSVFRFSPEHPVCAIVGKSKFEQRIEIWAQKPIQLWALAANREIAKLENVHRDFTFSPDGATCAAVVVRPADGAVAKLERVVVWETRTGKELAAFPGCNRFFAFS